MTEIYRALADRTRRTILDELQERDEQTLFEICSRLATKRGLGSSRQAISQHLEVLEAAGLLSTRRDGRYKFHSINTRKGGRAMRIHLAGIYVDDQDKALRFYTEVLGFLKKEDFPVGVYRWMTVVTPGEEDGTQLLLEPDAHPAVKPFKKALVDDGIPFTSFGVPDVQSEYERLRDRGVRFTQPPTDLGPATTAVLEDTCGNLIAIAQRNET